MTILILPISSVNEMLSAILSTVQGLERKMESGFKRIENRIECLEYKMGNGENVAPVPMNHFEISKSRKISILWPLKTVPTLRKVEANMIDPYYLKRLVCTCVV